MINLDEHFKSNNHEQRHISIITNFNKCEGGSERARRCGRESEDEED